ncbi:MAG TPA: S8 family serine peptidase [Vicinamibacterales bacterium]|nr:S8 family serine peptidase [Vicinamibacterales bacterium]
MRLCQVAVCLAVALLGAVAHASAQPARGRSVAGQIVVMFAPGSNASEKADAHRVARGRVVDEIAAKGIALVAVAEGDEAAAAARYRRHPNVRAAEPNYIRHVPEPTAHDAGAVVPGDHYFGQQWGFHNTGQEFYCIAWVFGNLCFFVGMPDADIDAPEAWAITTGSPAVTVAVIDTGIDYTHPDLASHYAGGYDFVHSTFDPLDDHGHGTHVAGTIAASLENLTGNPAAAEGVVGVAPQARLLAYKVCAADGTCTDFAVIQAIARAVAEGARVINMSLGDTQYSQALADAVQEAWDAGVVLVAGAGNDGTTTPFYPAALDHVVAVGAFDEDHRRASFSNYGTWVDIAAPGNYVLSTYPASKCVEAGMPGDTGCYAWLSGTSMATPHVAGAAALLWSRGDVTSNTQVVDLLMAGADPAGVSSERLDSWTMHGGLNLHDSLSDGLTEEPATGVTVAASTPEAREAGLQAGVFTVTRAGDASALLTVQYVVSGSAIAGTDYQSLPGTVSFEAGAVTATIAVVPIDDELLESNEQVVVSLTAGTGYDVGGAATASVSIVSDDLPPDLTISAAGAPGLSGADADLVVTDTTRNQGTGVAGASMTGFYLSSNSSFDASDVFIGNRSVPRLLPGETHAGSTTLRIPPSTVTGTYYVLVRSDWDAQVPENVETNNVKASGSIKIGPDMAVSALTVPASAAAGVAFSISETTLNQGGGRAAATATRFFLSTNSSLDAADVLLGSRDVSELAAGASSAGSTSVTVPASTPGGSYYVIASADAPKTLAETNEANNTRSVSLKIGADLVVSALGVPSSAAFASTISVTDSTKNQGAGPAASSSTAFYLSDDALLDAADVLLGSRPVGDLTAGAVSTASTPLQIPAGTVAGIYYVVAKADWAGAVPEGVESNNARAASIKIGPDLAVSALTAPSSANAGGSIVVTDTTKNQGTDPVGTSSTTRFYLSANSSLGAGDVPIGSRTVGPLAVNGIDTGSATLVIPAQTVPGSYYIVAVADGDGAVPESLENNNTRPRSLSISAPPGP